jgi:hypothetical protein
MTTYRFDQLYVQLTPRERLPLIMAAHVRGDAAEQNRLVSSARTRSLQVPDYYPLARAQSKAVFWHMLTLLDLAGRFWQWWGLWVTYALPDALEEDRSDRRSGGRAKNRRSSDGDLIERYRARGITRYYASRFVVYIDAWKQFCADLHMDPEAQLNFMIGWGLVTQTEKAARRLAFDAEETAQFLRLETDPVADDPGLECGPVQIENVAELVRDWHTILDEMIRHEGGE